METIVDRIRLLCVKNHTSITKLEVELGYANGTIGKWKNAKKRPPLEKVLEIAARLGTTAEYLYDGEKIEKVPAPEGEQIEDPDIRNIARAKKRMSEQEWARQYQIIKLSFGDYFSDNYEDDDTDE